MTPEKINCGIVGRPGNRLSLFSEFKILQDGRSDFLSGFRTRFSEGMLTGSLSSSGKAVSIYKHYMSIIELSFQTQMDFSQPNKPIVFGMGLHTGGGGG